MMTWSCKGHQRSKCMRTIRHAQIRLVFIDHTDQYQSPLIHIDHHWSVSIITNLFWSPLIKCWSLLITHLGCFILSRTNGSNAGIISAPISLHTITRAIDTSSILELILQYNSLQSWYYHTQFRENHIHTMYSLWKQSIVLNMLIM